MSDTKVEATIRQATMEDQERIGRFLHEAYQDRAQYKFPERWLWEYVTNPFWNAERLPIWLAEVDGQIVGQTCEMFVPLKLAEKTYAAAWGVDYIVLPQFRRQGIGRKLQEAQSDYHDIFMVLSMSPISRRVLVSLGFEQVTAVLELGKTIRFTSEQALKILNSKLGESNVLSRACRDLRLGRVMAGALNWAHRLRDSGRLQANLHEFTIERVERFDQEIDRLWTWLAPGFAAAVERKAEYLNWKFVEQPHIEYERFVLRETGVLRGYVIVRTGIPPEANVGIIADLLAAPDDVRVIDALLVYAIRHLERAGVKQITAASSVPNYVDRFLQLGFKEINQVIPMFRCKTAQHAPTDGWFLSMGDHDWDQYPLL